MSDPVRLVDDPSSPLARSAISAWSAERPSADARARALALSTLVSSAAVGTAAATSAAATSTAATSKAIGGAVGATKVAAGSGALTAGVTKGLIVGAVVAGGSASVVVATQRLDPAPQVAPAIAIATAQAPRVRPPLNAAATTTANPAISTETSPVDDAPVADVGDLPSAPLPVPRPPAPPPATEITPPPSAFVATELASLDDARAALRRGDAAGAVAIIDAFEAAHPRTSLRDEATVVRVDALLRSGDRERAVEIARAFVARSPTSPYAARLRRIADSAVANEQPPSTIP